MKNPWYVPYAVFKHTEFELYQYPATLQRCQEYNEATLLAYSSPGVGEIMTTGKISDPTGSKVMRLMVPGIRMSHDRLIVMGIDRALVMLDGIHREIFEVYYCEGYNRHKAMSFVGLSKTSFYRVRNRLVYQVAICLGWYHAG